MVIEDLRMELDDGDLVMRRHGQGVYQLISSSSGAFQYCEAGKLCRK